MRKKAELNHRRAARLTAAVLGGCGVLGGAACAAELPSEIVIPGERVFPESLTSSADGSVFIGSIQAKTIFRAKPGAATAEAWVNPGTDDLQSIFGVLADDRSHTLWACSSTPAFGPPGGAPPPPAALYAFDLKTGAPKGHYVFPTAGGLCNDIAVAADGTAYATDTMNMEVVRLKKGAKALEVWAGNGAFGPKGGVLDGISVLGKRVLVNALVTSKLFSVPINGDGSAGTVVEVKLDRPIERPDGMRAFGKEGLLVVEGGHGGRLSRITLNGDSGVATTIKEGYPDGPVAVTVVGTTAYVLEGQLALMMRRGPATTDSPAKPFHATAVPVGKP
jgi:sugar lactone lactonase YvrE